MDVGIVATTLVSTGTVAVGTEPCGNTLTKRPPGKAT